jgi:hypothetical protein
MIQRIQSLWLFFAAFVSAALFIFPLYHYTPAGSAVPLLMGAKNEYLLLLLATVMVLLPLIAIFMFKNRKRQKALIWLNVLTSAGFIAAMLMKIQNLKNAIPPATNDNFALPGPVIPVVGIILLFLALGGIRKDEALLRSVDRLR